MLRLQLFVFTGPTLFSNHGKGIGNRDHSAVRGVPHLSFDSR
ncbi:hypothetical protein LBMAG21_14770 [Armatimonadota bacterium]|nr:hypothetical protein LBMAG21_14770 [Armatimonadota bacterium]